MVEALLDAGAGFGTADQNARVEAAAIGVVTENYEADGWTVTSVEAEKVGWDLTAERDVEIRHIEVKGASGSRPVVLLTANEHRAASTDPGLRLAVVTEALSDRPKLMVVAGPDAMESASPTVYRVDLR